MTSAADSPRWNSSTSSRAPPIVCNFGKKARPGRAFSKMSANILTHQLVLLTVFLGRLSFGGKLQQSSEPAGGEIK